MMGRGRGFLLGLFSWLSSIPHPSCLGCNGSACYYRALACAAIWPVAAARGRTSLILQIASLFFFFCYTHADALFTIYIVLSDAFSLYTQHNEEVD